jgi:peptidoglycan glycosyltransferase
LITAAIANGGQIMKPYVVDQVIGFPIDRPQVTEPEKWVAPISAEVAATLRDLMVEVVNRGTGTGAALNSVQVAGKTGTAEVADAESHAWFAGFAPADDPQVAVVVLVENAGTGGSIAAPIARKVIAAALGL